MKVYIVAEVEPVDTDIGNGFTVADALAQTLGGEVGTMLFEVEESAVEEGGRRAVYRLTHIGAYPGDVVDITSEGGQILYPVDELSGEVDGAMLPVTRWMPPYEPR